MNAHETAFKLPLGACVLLRFRVENYRSIKDEQELSLVASTLSEHQDALMHVPQYDLDVLRAAAIYGANASGKSTVVKALSFMKSAVEDSQVRWKPQGLVPLRPFALDPDYAGAPSLFAVDLLLGDVRHEYGFVADSSRILEEWLYAWPKGRKQEWFTRDASRADEFAFSRMLTGENRAISALTRPNSLFLSAAAQNNHEMLAPVHRWFSERLLIEEDRSHTHLTIRTSDRCRNPEYLSRVFDVLRDADLGISDVVVDETPQDSSNARNIFEKIWLETRVGASALVFMHDAGEGRTATLPFWEQSEGTLTFFAFAGAIVDLMDSGGTLVVDELDRSLHPHLSTHIVRMFNDPATNPKGAQLIFNTHDTNLLDADLLRRDQIWFTEKGEDGATHLFPLTDFRARKYENFERGYLQGRYGAVPTVRAPAPLRKTGT